MSTPSPAYRRQSIAARTGRTVPAIGYAARTGWLKQQARPAEKSAWHIAEEPGSSASPDTSVAGSDSNILLLNPSALDASELEMLERLSGLGLQFPMTALAGGDFEESAGALDQETQKRLAERLHAIAGLLKPTDDIPAPAVAPKKIERGHLRLDFKTCRAYWRNEPVNLTITEFNIVNLFASHIGENLSYREIYDVVHGIGFCAGDGTHGYQTNVRSLIKRIRQKFHALDAGFDDIENHRGYGYRWRDLGAAAPLSETQHASNPEEPRVVMVYVVNPAAQ
ncbi:MAG: winged helix-turn-helix domain-containing protein [Parvibaculum sp.]|uniref:winged helix-turn-helix domain-containing protein n=1 Tax=Parvibaculum sp. TaxID=2024848 RepID=UPI0025FD7408|nr:winged helix-turn-helix domain-containing protein [Parvibaculum sp.]MCE9650968.1 winged helix-turn-helix domain-containing protein [Parvibaculum sp.]